MGVVSWRVDIGNDFYPCLIFPGDTETAWVESLTGAPFDGWPLTLPPNISPGAEVTNAHKHTSLLQVDARCHRETLCGKYHQVFLQNGPTWAIFKTGSYKREIHKFQVPAAV